MNDELYLAQLRHETRQILARVLEGRTEVVYLGAPRHRNLGDSLIWAGSLNYLREMGIRVALHGDATTLVPSALSKVAPDSPILFQGGGNLGDLYPAEEEFRLRVIQHFPERQFILLPQTSMFTNPASITRSSSVYQSARTTVLARDTATLSWLREAMPDVESTFCFDLALGARVREWGGQGDELRTLARQDREARSQDERLGSDWTYTRANRIAWQAALTPGRLMARLPSRAQSAFSKKAGTLSLGILHLNARAADSIGKGIGVLVTNRLHGHILCCLAGIPHMVSDNSYGKVSRIFNEYTGIFSTANWVETLEEGMARGLQMLQQQ